MIDGHSARAVVHRVQHLLGECRSGWWFGLAGRVLAGELGGRVGVAPRLFLKKLGGDVLDRVDQFPDFDPRVHYAPTLTASELTSVEREAAHLGSGTSVDDVELDV